MSRIATIYKILVASPSDVKEERELLKDIVFKWNASHSKDNDVYLDLVMWESHTYPELSGRPQGIINNSIVVDADLMIGIFWTRIGTPTGNDESGTAEEISLLVESNKKTLVYFSNKAIQPNNIDLEQYSKLKGLREKYQSMGLIESYNDLTEFKEKISNHLSQVISDLKKDHDYSDNRVSYSETFPESFERDFSRAKDIYIFGSNQSDLLIGQFSTLEERIKSGIPTKVLFHDPYGDVVKMSRMRFPGEIEPDHESMRIINSLRKLDKLRVEYPNLEIRIIDYLMSYGGCIFKSENERATAYIKQYTFKSHGGAKKPKYIYKQESKMYGFIENEAMNLWEYSKEWLEG